MSLMPVCELWIPNQDGTALQLVNASYTGYESFKEISRDITFASGEGLPGRVWSTGLPEVMTALDTPASFVRARAAEEAGLSAGLGLPIVQNGAVTAVLTFLYSQGPEPSGIMEVWEPNQERTSLVWRSGFYGRLDDVKEASKSTEFAFDQGLPGQVWKSKLPMLIPSLWPTSDFARDEVAAVVGLTTGLAIPVVDGDSVRAVATLLSTSDMPFAKVMEIWLPNEDNTALRRESGYYGRYSAFLDPQTLPTFAHGEGLPGQVWASGVPQLIAPLDEQSGFARYQAAQSVDLTMAVGIPIIADGEVTAVVLMLD